MVVAMKMKQPSLEPQLPKAYNLGDLTQLKNPEAPDSES